MVIVAIHLHNQQSNNFREEQQQNAKWSGLARYVCSFLAFPVGSPSKGVNYTPLWLTVSTARVVAVDLLYYQYHPYLQSCWRKYLGLEALILKTVAKLGVARRPPCPQTRSISPRHCLNPLRFLVFIPRQQTSPFHTRNHTSHYRKYTTTARCNRKVSTDVSRNFWKGVRENDFSLPNNGYQAATQLPVTKMA